MSVLSELKSYLIAQGIGSSTTIFRGALPASPDVAIALYETGGSGPALGLGADGVQHEYPNVQIVVRGDPYDYDTPRATAESAYKALAKVQGSTLTGTQYLLVQPLQSPNAVLGRDENNRHRISFNARVGKEPS